MAAMNSKRTADPILLEAQRALRDGKLPPKVTLELLMAGLIAREQSESRLRHWVNGLTIAVGLLVLIHVNPQAGGSSLQDLITWARALLGG